MEYDFCECKTSKKLVITFWTVIAYWALELGSCLEVHSSLCWFKHDHTIMYFFQQFLTTLSKPTSVWWFVSTFKCLPIKANLQVTKTRALWSLWKSMTSRQRHVVLDSRFAYGTEIRSVDRVQDIEQLMLGWENGRLGVSENDMFHMKISLNRGHWHSDFREISYLQNECRCEDTIDWRMALESRTKGDSWSTWPRSSSATRIVHGFFWRSFITASGGIMSPVNADTKQKACSRILHLLGP